jgi:hypothetical protein
MSIGAGFVSIQKYAFFVYGGKARRLPCGEIAGGMIF